MPDNQSVQMEAHNSTSHPFLHTHNNVKLQLPGSLTGTTKHRLSSQNEHAQFFS